MYEKFGGEQKPLDGELLWKYERYLIMKMTGWDFRTIDQMTHGEVSELFSIANGIHKAHQKPKKP